MRRRELREKRVLLTGATSGIGWSLAVKLIAQGSRVVATGRRAERLSALQSLVNHNPNLHCLPGDLCDGRHRERLLEVAIDRLGGLDILINNAGVGAVGPFESASPERLRGIFELNFFSAVELTRLALPWLKSGDAPVICNINSVLGYRAVPMKSEYCAAKFALRGWSDALRVELKPRGIEVLTIAPSTTDTEFFQSLLENKASPRRMRLRAQSSDAVAGAIIRSLTRRCRENFPSLQARILLGLTGLFPRATDYLLEKLTRGSPSREC